MLPLLQHVAFACCEPESLSSDTYQRRCGCNKQWYVNNMLLHQLISLIIMLSCLSCISAEHPCCVLCESTRTFLILITDGLQAGLQICQSPYLVPGFCWLNVDNSCQWLSFAIALEYQGLRLSEGKRRTILLMAPAA